MSATSITCIQVFLLASLSPLMLGQSADTPIFEQRASAIKEGNQKIIQQALLVREKVSAVSRAEIDRQLLEPLPEPIELPPALSKEMSSADIAEHARESNLRVGYCYKCMSCHDWHINLAGGYAIAPDVIVTCDHVLASKTKMDDGFLVVFDHQGNIACAVAVLAHNADMDAAIIKVAGSDFNPVPLNSDVKQGSSSYCFSYPLGQQGFFSAGVVNRFFWDDTYRGQDKNSIDALCHLRVNFGNDWAPGSSGSPLFDAKGNVIGHVSTIAGLSNGKGKPQLLVLREGIPAASIRRLAATLQNPGEIKRLANAEVTNDKTPTDLKTLPEK